MSIHGCKCLKLVESCKHSSLEYEALAIGLRITGKNSKRLEITGNRLKWLAMNGNGLKYLDLAGNGLKWLDWAMKMRMTIWVMDDQIRSPMTMLFTNYMHFQYIINEYIKGE